MKPSTLRPSLLALPILGLAAGLLAACGGDDGGTEPPVATTRVLTIEPTFISHGAEVPPSDAAHVVVRDGAGAVLATLDSMYADGALRLGLELTEAVTVELEVELTSNDQAVWGGHVDGVDIEPSSMTRTVSLDLYPGGLAAGAVDGVHMVTAPSHLVEGTVAAFDAAVTGMADAPLFWGVLEPTLAHVTDGEVAGLLPGTVRVVAASGAYADTALIEIDAAVAGITLSPPEATMAVGNSATFEAAVTDGRGDTLPDASLTWTVSDEAVVTVAATGGTATVTALAAGEAWLVAEADSGVRDSARLTVEPVQPVEPTRVATALTLRPDSVTVAAVHDSVRVGLEGEARSLRIEARVTDQYQDPMAADVQWSVDDSVALAIRTDEVSGRTWVEALTADGGAVIASAGELADTTRIVVDQQPTTMELLRAVDTVAVGTSVYLFPEVRDANGMAIADAAITWASTDTTVAVADSGRAYGIAEGTATITATAGTASDSIEIVVIPTPVAAIEIVAGDSAEVTPGHLLATQAKVRVTDAAGDPISGADVEWTVHDGGALEGTRTMTNGYGEAWTRWQLGDTLGEQTLTARAGDRSVTFTATAVEPVPGGLNFSVHPPDSAFIGEEVTLKVQAEDQFGYILRQAGIRLVANASGDGAPSYTTFPTDSMGGVFLHWTLGSAVGVQTLTVFHETNTAVTATMEIEAVPVPLTAIDLRADRTLLTAVEDTLRMRAVGIDSLGGERTISDGLVWSSSDTAVAAVDSGLVRATGSGTAWIGVTDGALSDSVQVTVDQEIVAMEVGLPGTGNNAIMLLSYVGEVQERGIWFSDANGHPTPLPDQGVTWSLDTLAAGVDVTFLGPDTSTTVPHYRFRAVGNQPRAAVLLDVTAVHDTTLTERLVAQVSQEVASIEIVGGDIALTVGDTLTVEARAFDAGGTPVESHFALEWSSSDASVASVADPSAQQTALSAHAAGTAELTVTAGDQTDTVTVTVTEP